jgi:EpsD family peptidyl-prolyl cis-trans isomerase
MRRIFFATLAFLFALPAVAQQVDPLKKPVAVVNGETITAEQLDQLYDRMGTQMRDRYDKAGGKAVFLDNYIKKRLLVQEAIKSGFDKRPDVKADVEAAKEATLFDRYVRDVVAATIVNDATIRKFYDEHPDQFVIPERIHVRHIVITAADSGPHAKTKGQALEIAKTVLTKTHELMGNNRAAAETNTAEPQRVTQFAQLAGKYSEDDATSQSGGDLGWLAKGQLDPDFEAAAWGLPIGVPSGLVETKFGYHIIFVEGKEKAGKEDFDHAKSSIREYLMNERSADVMTTVSRLTNELRANGRVAVYMENIR